MRDATSEIRLEKIMISIMPIDLFIPGVEKQTVIFESPFAKKLRVVSDDSNENFIMTFTSLTI